MMRLFVLSIVLDELFLMREQFHIKILLNTLILTIGFMLDLLTHPSTISDTVDESNRHAELIHKEQNLRNEEPVDLDSTRVRHPLGDTN